MYSDIKTRIVNNRWDKRQGPYNYQASQHRVDNCDFRSNNRRVYTTLLTIR